MKTIKNKNTLFYEGNTKNLYFSNIEETFILHFKDDIKDPNSINLDKISGKGIISNRISQFLMQRLEDINIPTHFIRSLNMREQLIRAVDVLPVVFIVRNIASGLLSKRLGVEEGIILSQPITELYIKNHCQEMQMINEDHMIAFNWSDKYELEEIKNYLTRINDFLTGLFYGIGIRLIDFKVEFGTYGDNINMNNIILVDELSPDTCSLRDLKTNEPLDSSCISISHNKTIEVYKEVAKRLKIYSD